MKKLVALAVAGAFIAPVYAADITVSGEQEWNYRDNNGATTSELDGKIAFGASGEVNGLKVSATIALDENGTGDGGANLSVAGGFGKVQLGDVSGAIDAIDDVTDFGKEASSGTGGTDANILWTLPSFAPGLTVNVSASADNQEGGAQDAEAGATGVSLKYSMAGISVGYGTQENDDGTKHSLVNATYSANGLSLGYEVFTDKSAASVDTDTNALGASYTMGDITLAFENAKTKSQGTTSKDITAVGLHYNLGGGLMVFLESKDDAKAAATQTNYFGAVYKF